MWFLNPPLYRDGNIYLQLPIDMLRIRIRICPTYIYIYVILLICLYLLYVIYIFYFHIIYFPFILSRNLNECVPPI